MQMRITRWLLVSIALTWAAAASAHDWYHPGCCNALKQHESGGTTGDCGPADLIKQVPEGTLFRQRGTGIEAVVPLNFSRRYPNQHDNDYHICVANIAGEYTGGNYIHVYCLYEPHGS